VRLHWTGRPYEWRVNDGAEAEKLGIRSPASTGLSAAGAANTIGEGWKDRASILSFPWPALETCI
jgi:hypothetical protein